MVEAELEAGEMFMVNRRRRERVTREEIRGTRDKKKSLTAVINTALTCH